MSTYKITIKAHPNFNNLPKEENLILTNDQLYAIAIMSTALLGDSRDEYFEIRDKALRKYNIDQLIKQSEAVVLDGDAAFDLDPQPGIAWLEEIANAINESGSHKKVTKKYTIKVEGYYRFYLLQFDNDDFYKSLWVFPEWIGKRGSRFLKYLYHGNTPLAIAV